MQVHPPGVDKTSTNVKRKYFILYSIPLQLWFKLYISIYLNTYTEVETTTITQLILSN